MKSSDPYSSHAPQLTRFEEFEAALKDYQPSEETKQVLQTTPLLLLNGPTSAGRNTIIEELLKTGKYHYIVSDTTRPPRVNDGMREQNGVEYWFRSEDDVLVDIQSGKYLEAELIHRQQVSGISVRELKKAHDAHKIAANEVDLGGIKSIVRIKPDAIIVLVVPPNFEEWQRRIVHRGKMSDAELNRRLETACTVFATALEHTYFRFVINDNLDKAVQSVDSIATKGSYDEHAELQARKLTEQLLKQTRQYLESKAA